jgi:hypothetical protein
MQNSKLLGNFAIYCENGADLRLAEQIHNRIRILAGFNLGTKSNKKRAKKCYIGHTESTIFRCNTLKPHLVILGSMVLLIFSL